MSRIDEPLKKMAARHRSGWQGAASCLAFLAVPAVFAHPGIDERIAEITRQIEAADGKKKPMLLVGRASLHLDHMDPAAALADLNTARELDSKCDAVLMVRARVRLYMNDACNAVTDIESFRALHPNDVPSLQLHARILGACGEWSAAASLFEKVVNEKAGSSEAWDFAEMADALRSAKQPGRAIEFLQKASKQFPSDLRLSKKLVDLLVETKRFDEALASIDTVIPGLNRAEWWLFQRGCILEEAGKPAEAQAAFARCRRAIDLLPPPVQAAPATASLISTIEARLRGLATRSLEKPSN